MTVDLPSPLADAGVVSVGGKQESQESRPQDLPYGQSFPAVPFSSHAEQHRAVAQTQYMYNQLQQMHYAQLGMMPMPHGMQFAMGPHDAQPQQQQQQQPMPQQLQQQPQRASEPSKESAGPAVAPLRASVPPIVSWPQAHSVTPATDIDLPAATSTAPLSISPPATAATDDVHEATPVPTSVDTPMADPVETLRAKVTALMPQVEPLDIKPDHYYGSTEDGVGVPVFKPTYEEFRDFYRFMKAIDKYGMESGIVKVVPPKEWRESLPPIDPRKLSDVQIRCAIKQQISGSGKSTVTNTLTRRRLNVKQWKDLCTQPENQTPTFETSDAIDARLRMVRAVSGRTSRSGEENCEDASLASPPKKRHCVLPTEIEVEEGEIADPDMNVGMNAPEVETRTTSVEDAPPIGHDQGTDTAQTPPATENENPLDAAAAPPASAIFTNEEMYPDAPFPSSPEYYAILEKAYWKNLTFHSPIYGTLFEDDWKEWNVAHLDNLLKRMPKKLPGVNTPYLYFGMWKATFPWHLEDMNLYSINYIHFGAPKQWYSIPQSHRERFERVAQSYFADDYRMCPEFLRHKTYHFSPAFLAKHDIPVYKCVHEEGEFMITYPFGYHAGYNLGYNCAESVNFALEQWLDAGLVAKPCDCISDSVRIDLMTMFDEPKANVVATKVKTVKEPKLPKPPKPVVIKPQTCVLCGQDDMDLLVVEPPPLPPTLAASEDGSAPAPARARRALYAHELCAEFVPEVNIVTIMTQGDEGQANVERRVTDVHLIPRQRWKLHCKYCNGARKGACVQCSRGNCVSAFHVTCAQREGLLLQRRIAPDEDGDYTVFECFCARHDPRREDERKQRIEFKLNQLKHTLDDWLADRACQPVPTVFPVWARWSDGHHYAGVITEDFREREQCHVVFWDGYTKIVPYADIELTRPKGGVAPDDLVALDPGTSVM